MQVYFRMSEEIAPDRAKAIIGAMQRHLPSDPSVKNPSRVMRLAGSVAWAKPDKPGRIDEPVTLVISNDPIGYHPAEIERHFCAEDREPTPPPKGSNGTPPPATGRSETSIVEIAELLDHVPPDAPYDEWLAALMAVHAATGGSDAGLALVEQWSARGQKYKPGEVAMKWRSFRSAGVSGATLAGLARRHGADLSAIRKRHMADQGWGADDARRAAANAERIIAGFGRRQREAEAEADTGAGRAEGADSGTAGHGAGEGDQDAGGADGGGLIIDPTPYSWTEPGAIRPREWLYGHHLIRKFTSVTVAPGGLGKSSLTIVEAMAMATGRQLLGQFVPHPLTVWLWNLEDPRDELARRVQATALRYDISATDLGGRLFVDTGRERELVTAEQTRNGAAIYAPVFAALEAAIMARGIDVLVIDPFVSSHRLTENDNTAIDAVAKQWGRVADRCNCAISLVHHARKLNGLDVTAEHSRGAIALVAAARDVRVLNHMTRDEAEKAGVEQPRAFFRVQSDKANLAPPEAARWVQMESIALPNGPLGIPGDHVGVPVPWSWPDAFEDVTAADLLLVQKAIDGKAARESSQSEDWAGHIVAGVLGLDAEDKADRARIRRLLKTWIKSGALRVVQRTDEKTRKPRPFIEVGEWADEAGAPP